MSTILPVLFSMKIFHFNTFLYIFLQICQKYIESKIYKFIFNVLGQLAKIYLFSMFAIVLLLFYNKFFNFNTLFYKFLQLYQK